MIASPWFDAEEAPLERGEVVCQNCWLAYNGHLDQCPQCEFYGPAADRAPEALAARKVKRSSRIFDRAITELALRATLATRLLGKAFLLRTPPAGSAEGPQVASL